MILKVEEKYYSFMNEMIEYLSECKEIQIKQLIEYFITRHNVNNEFIIEIIHYLQSKGSIVITEDNVIFQNNKIKMVTKPEIEQMEKIEEKYPQICVSFPPFDIYGLESKISQHNMNFDTLKNSFHRLFNSATKTIGICSPFLEYNGIDDFLPVLLKKAKEGVKIQILSRQISDKDPNNRYNQILDVKKVFNDHKLPISIRNYHYYLNGKIASSTHAKIVVIDSLYAYVGSGEIRKNSFEKNFEIGIIVDGEEARKIGIIFNDLYSVSEELFNEEVI